MQNDAIDGEPGIAGVHRRVREAILSGELVPGAVVSQVRLADELGVSRTPLREALRMLQREGLVQAEHNRRVRISPFSVDDLEEIYASRVVVEALAIRLTVPALTADELADAAQCVAAMRGFAEDEDYDRWQVPHRRFHELLVGHAGSRLVQELRLLSDHAERYRRMYTLNVRHAWSVGVADHQSILTACERGDADTAAGALALHFGRVALTTVALVDPTHDPVKVRTALRMVTREQDPR